MYPQAICLHQTELLRSPRTRQIDGLIINYIPWSRRQTGLGHGLWNVRVTIHKLIHHSFVKLRWLLGFFLCVLGNRFIPIWIRWILLLLLALATDLMFSKTKLIAVQGLQEVVVVGTLINTLLLWTHIYLIERVSDVSIHYIICTLLHPAGWLGCQCHQMRSLASPSSSSSTKVDGCSSQWTTADEGEELGRKKKKQSSSWAFPQPFSIHRVRINCD